jgi:hypothetical protein
MFDEGHASLPVVTTHETYMFVSIAQMGHDERNAMKDYLTMSEQYFTAFCRGTVI